MKPLHIAMGIALVGAAGLVLFGDKSPNAGVAEPVERAAAPRTATATAPARAPVLKAGVEPAILRLLPRDELIGGADAEAGQLFGSQNWNPPAPPPSQQVAVAVVPPPPVAPPLPFTLIGKSAGSGAYEVYLARGDQVYLVREKMTIDGTYRVDKIVPPMLTMTYLPLNQVQQLNIGVFD